MWYAQLALYLKMHWTITLTLCLARIKRETTENSNASQIWSEGCRFRWGIKYSTHRTQFLSFNSWKRSRIPVTSMKFQRVPLCVWSTTSWKIRGKLPSHSRCCRDLRDPQAWTRIMDRILPTRRQEMICWQRTQRTRWLPRPSSPFICLPKAQVSLQLSTTIHSERRCSIVDIFMMGPSLKAYVSRDTSILSFIVCRRLAEPLKNLPYQHWHATWPAYANFK